MSITNKKKLSLRSQKNLSLRLFFHKKKMLSVEMRYTTRISFEKLRRRS